MASTSNATTLPLVLSGAALLLAGGAAGWVLGGSSASAGSKAEVEGIVRAYILARRENLETPAVFASLVIDRLFDGFTVLLMLLVTLFTDRKSVV